MKRILFLSLCLAFSLSFATAREEEPHKKLRMEGEEKASPTHASLTSPGRDWGVIFGNSARTTGIRFNFTDDHVAEVKGLNVTFWKPEKNPDFRMYGASLALVGAAYKEARGINVAGIGQGGENFIPSHWSRANTPRLV